MNSISSHQHNIRVYAEDVDFMGIVYHANYLCYLERARTELLRQNNLILSDLLKSDILFAINELSINYLLPAKLDDHLTIRTIIKELKACSLLFYQEISNQHGQLICKASVKVVCVGRNLKPKRLPDIISKK
ncbi:esterase [Legionella norrlandica]|uniref:Esterase n=1 Tax=Legionella norrlandica TaxID=1498499 RepID=A0A0A2SSZ7_9GAMM|nr:tol-pal system-associated acyl-CoA thioesterase [Legionella norrlandica]KGP63852.1 esterase [Legionella norrlandica]